MRFDLNQNTHSTLCRPASSSSSGRRLLQGSSNITSLPKTNATRAPSNMSMPSLENSGRRLSRYEFTSPHSRVCGYACKLTTWFSRYMLRNNQAPGLNFFVTSTSTFRIRPVCCVGLLCSIVCQRMLYMFFSEALEGKKREKWSDDLFWPQTVSILLPVFIWEINIINPCLQIVFHHCISMYSMAHPPIPLFHQRKVGITLEVSFVKLLECTIISDHRWLW